MRVGLCFRGWKGRDFGRDPEEDKRRKWKKLVSGECERIKGL